MLTAKGAIAQLKEAVANEGGQIAFALKHGVDRSYLNNILQGHRPLTDRVAKSVGLKRVMVFAKIKVP